MSQHLDDELDEMYGNAHGRRMDEMNGQIHDMNLDDLNAEMDMGQHDGMYDDLSLENQGQGVQAGGMGHSLADEFMDMEADMSGVHLGDTLAGELNDGHGQQNMGSLLSSMTTSPDPGNPHTPPQQHLSLSPDTSPGHSSRGSSPGGEYPSMTSTRYYTAYSPGQLQHSAPGRKAKSSTTPSMLSADDTTDEGNVSMLLDTSLLGGGDTMRDILEGKMQTGQLGAGGKIGSIPAPAMVSTPGRHGPRLERDPMVVIEQCMADTDRFLRALQRYNGPTKRLDRASASDAAETPPSLSAAALPGTISSKPASLGIAEDEALADHLHKLAARERKLDDRQRELEKLSEKWEEARYGEGVDLDFGDLPDLGSDCSAPPTAKPSALARVKSMSCAPSPSAPNPSVAPVSVDIPSHIPALFDDHLPDTLHTLSETLHAQSSALISTGRQLRAIRAAINTAQEGLANEDRALRGIDEWEAERVREGLRGGKRSDALNGLVEGLEAVWETERPRWRVGGPTVEVRA